jgi:hypothetical protein
MSDEIVGMYELLDAIEAVIKAADPAKREALAQTIDGFAEDFPEDFYWAVGPQAPSLLAHIMMTIDAAPRAAIRLVDRKPEGKLSGYRLTSVRLRRQSAQQ